MANEVVAIDEANEIAKFRNGINETHEEVCAEMCSFGNVPPPKFAWRDLAERAEAAHKRELTAKDALVKELVDLLTKVNAVEYVDVFAWFEGCVDDEQQEWLESAMDAIHECQLAFDNLIAKAKEVVK